jgi:hypothetical protein
MKSNFRRENKGQVIVITALLIALIMLSTVVYVTAIVKQAPAVEVNQYDLYPQYHQSLRNTLISALANITKNGDTQVLDVDISKLNQLFSSHYFGSMLQINYTLPNDSQYQNGLCISNQQKNHAVIGAQVIYQLSSIGNAKISNAQGMVNVTSEAYLSGNCVQINETTKQATLTVQVLNEGKPVLAAGFTCYYQNGTDWIKAENFAVRDFGNGTYTIVFLAQLSQPGDQIVASLNVLDQRGINVSVNSICANL